MSAFFCHPSSFVDEGATIGEQTRIWHFSHIMGGAVVGAKCNIGQNVFIDSNVRIGNQCKIQNNVSIYKHVTLEDKVFCGPSMVFTNVFNPRAHIPRMHEARPTLIREGASLGANCTVICGVSIGRYAFIGAGSVITKDVPDYALVYGNPSKIRGWVCECGTKLNAAYVCCTCKKTYTICQDILIPTERRI